MQGEGLTIADVTVFEGTEVGDPVTDHLGTGSLRAFPRTSLTDVQQLFGKR